MAKSEAIPCTPSSCIQIFSTFPLDKNCVFSPSSIQLAISFLANGADGKTLEQLLNFLESDSVSKLNSIASELITNLTKPSTGKGPDLSFVGGLWVDDSMQMKQNFISTAETVYKAKVGRVDFKTKAEKFVRRLNQWAAESTNGLIKTILHENSISTGTRVVLANALYFKGEWSYPFEKSKTKKEKFFLLDGSTIKVPFMDDYYFTHCIRVFEDFKVLRLPYRKTTLSMFIFLPNDIDGLPSMMKSVGSDSLFLEKYVGEEWSCNWIRTREFKVPKFKINYKFEASDALKAAGLDICFSDEADFGEMVDGVDLKVQKVNHSAQIEIDEEGAEAAAVTEIDMGWSMCDEEPVYSSPIDFVADHPFMYVVRSEKSGLVLFMGHVVNPLLEIE